ncbi:putative sodium-dependent multivitamin transporter isoform X2 [Amblyomma americanum]
MSSFKSLDAADSAVFGVLTALGYLVGLYFSFVRRRSQVATGDADSASKARLEAFLGSRSLPATALAVSIVASLANGMSVVGFVGHHYAYGFHMLWVLALSPIAMLVTSVVVVPLLYRLQATSIFEYLRMRFDNKVGIAACLIYFVLSQTLGAVGIYSAAIGISTMYSVPLLYSNIAIGLAGTIYTALGGFRSVVWADCVQAFVMLASPLTIIGKVLYDRTGVSPPLRPISDINLTDVVLRANFDVSTDENILSAVIAALPYVLVRMGVDQMAVQRYMAARSLRDARRIVVGGVLSVVAFFIIVAVSSAAIIYWYRDCDPVLHGDIKSYDQILPLYIRDSLSDATMLRGLFLAGLLGASTSTVSSVVNSNAATIYVDIIAPYLNMSERRAVAVIRMLAVASGTTMTLFAIAVPLMGTAAKLFLSLYSSASGPFIGLVLLAISSPWVNAKGAAWASLLVCGIQLWHAVGRIVSGVPPPPHLRMTLDRCPTLLNGTDIGSNHTATSPDIFPLYRVSFFWISFIGALLTMLLGTTLSIATGGARYSRRNLRLTSPVFLNFWRRFRRLRSILQLDEVMGDYAKNASNDVEDDDDDARTALDAGRFMMCEKNHLHAASLGGGP